MVDPDWSPGIDDTETPVHRRRLLFWLAGGLGVVVVGGLTGFELVNHGVLPGKQFLDEVDGACSVPAPALSFDAVGPTFNGHFFPSKRRRTVDFSIAFPPGHRLGDNLPLVVMLHGLGDNHATAIKGMTPAQAVALRWNGRPLTPMAMVTVDGGHGYWNPHPGDDPMSMVVEELIPRCKRLGLGVAPQRIGAMGISMGGYGALALTERFPRLIAAVAVISPAIWTSFDQSHRANPEAFSSASSFAANNVIDHVGALRGIPLRVATGTDDPFLPGVTALIDVVPKDAVTVLSAGCHTDPFFLEQEPPSLAFLSRHLA